MNKYIKSLDEAFKKYSRKAHRPGHPTSFFSRLRHSFGAYPALETFIKKISTLADEEAAEEIRLTIKKGILKNNKHSFLRYLLDELQLNFPEEKWYLKDPNRFMSYHGIVYRGTDDAPLGEDGAFAIGLEDYSTSDDITSYASDASGTTGLSTSKDIQVAQGYAELRFMKGATHAFVYEIDGRNNLGIDVVETLKFQGKDTNNPFSAAIHKQEVNIRGNIKNTDIISCLVLDNKGRIRKHVNPHYQSEYKEKEIKAKTAIVSPETLTSHFPATKMG